MSKERLKEFKDYIDFLDDSQDMQDHGRFVDTLHSLYEDGWFDWIFLYAIEQAERVRELEEELEKSRTGLFSCNMCYERSEQQNKRYREALEKLVNAPQDMSRGRYADYAYRIAREELEESE